jgi:DNA (cytosine-5)-methyltransferase 1
MNCLEIFSGAGGLAKGLEQAGFRHTAFVEFNQHACASLRENFHADKVFCGDIRDFDLSTLASIDLVAGGPPCQPFSLGGKHQAHKDHRDMFPYAIKAIEKLAPKAFIFENVKGLLRASFAEYFEYILLRLASPSIHFAQDASWREQLAQLKKQDGYSNGLRYNVQFKLLNAADYGVPQTRERVFIVGTRADLPKEWSFPDPTHSEGRLLWDAYITGDYWKRHGIEPCFEQSSPADIERIVAALRNRYGMFEPDTRPWQTVRDALVGLPDPRSAHEFADHVYRDGARTYPGHTGSFIDWPSKTLKAGGHGVPGGENMIRFADGQVRYFTVREAKRIQTFPDGFLIRGAWGEAMRQLGNAVPVSLAHLLARQLWQMLSANETRLAMKKIA